MGLTPLLSLIVIAAIVGLLLLLMLVDTGRRGNELSQLADTLTLHYRPYAAVSSRIRDAHFALLDIGQFRHFRHLMEGQLTPDLYLNLFDYSLITPDGASTQTLLILSCPLPLNSRFCINRKQWLQQDSFSESRQHPLITLRNDQKPLLLRPWKIASDNPQQLWPLLQPHVCDWLLAHPHLHIEWSDGILLLCRPQHILAPEHITLALKHSQELIQHLQQAAQH